MLDDLLGRTKLKERIATLEEERDSLRAQLDAENDRRAEAVHARQDAEERVNRLEDRIAGLEGKLGRDEERSALEFRRRESVRGDRLDDVLDRLRSIEGHPETICTAFVDGNVPEDLRELLGDRTSLVSRAEPCLVIADDAGLLAAALRPPIAPDPFCTWTETPQLDRVRLRPSGRYSLALIRANVFAMGVYEADERVNFEGFESDIKSDHSKGGFSQARFERLRDEQIAAHIERCEAVLAEAPDPLYVVGDRRLVGEFADRAEATAAVDATGPPREALPDAFEDFWTVRLYGL